MTTLSKNAAALLGKLAEAGDPWTWAIRGESNEDGYTYSLAKHAPLDNPAFAELMNAGFLRDFANGGGYEISDRGRMAFIKSTDEMGDGLVHIPVAPARFSE